MVEQLIIHDHKYCQYIPSDEQAFKKVKKLLSFRLKGVEYTAAYKNGWHGINYLISNKGTFSSGLLNTVNNYFDTNGITYTLLDKREKVQLNEPLDITNKLNDLGMVPRDYQEKIVSACFNNERGIVRACTGSGKTLCTALIAAKLNKPTIIYVIGIDLLRQFHDLFSKLFDEKIGMIGDGHCDIQRINIATIWTIGHALNQKHVYVDEEDYDEKEDFKESNRVKILKMLQDTRVHIIDECHIVTCDTIKSIYKQMKPEYIYGFSGTPFRDDNSDLLIKSILGDQIVDVSASELIGKGILAQPYIKFIDVPSMSLSMANYQTVYKDYVVENPNRNALILKYTLELVEKKYTPLVLFKQIKHGRVLYELLSGSGVNCELLSGKDSLERRLEVKAMIEGGEIDVVLASSIFDIGVDIPKLSGLILCGGGISSIRVLQRVGRVIRGYKDKKHAAIVDFYDQTKFLKKHSLRRLEVYESETGFIVKKSGLMKKK